MAEAQPEPTREQAVQRLRDARTAAEIQAARIYAFPLAEDPAVAAEMRLAEQRRNERRTRERKLGHDTMLPPKRHPSHDQREVLLDELRRRRANGLGLMGIEERMKNACYDNKCGKDKCAGSLEYQSLCLQFLIECIAARIKITMVHRGALGRYPFPADLADLLNRFMADPINMWLDFPTQVYGLGPRLEQFFFANIDPLQEEPNPKPVRDEAKSFRRHYERIRDMLLVLKSCEQPMPAA